MNRAYLKWVFLGVLFIAALIGGMFLSGWIMLLWLKLSQVSLDMGTYFKYVSAMDTPPNNAPKNDLREICFIMLVLKE